MNILRETKMAFIENGWTWTSSEANKCYLEKDGTTIKIFNPSESAKGTKDGKIYYDDIVHVIITAQNGQGVDDE